MSLKEWLALLILFLTYLLVGGAIFLQIESAEELKTRNKEQMERLRIQELLQLRLPEDPSDTEELAQKLQDYCGKPVFNQTGEEERPFKWNLYNSFYFAFTVVSSIGYGNLAPTCLLGRILCIFYALIGIPMNGILLATLGEFFSKTFLRAHHRYKEHRYETRMALITDIILYLIPGFVLFIFLPAGLFVVFEGWTYDVAVYYAFVTLTTIGFGDYVAGQQVHKEFGAWFTVYQVLIVWWIVFGLGYLIMILGFITRAMRSKRMLDLEKRMAHKIKRTQSKLWRGMRDMGYLRRLLNEVYLLKFKPVYREHEEVMVNGRERSRSLPSLMKADRDLINISDGWDSDGGGTWASGCRRRANSERVSTPHPVLHRVRSESDLENIDKSATFAVNNSIAPAELLAHVVEALSCAEEEEELEEMEEEMYGGKDVVEAEEGRGGDGGKGGWGFHGFSDDEILASEKHNRSRAASEAPIPISEDGDLKGGHPAEWTWYGTSASKRIHELMRMRQKPRGSSILRRDSSPPPSVWKSFKRRGSRLSYRNSIGSKSSDSEMNAPRSLMPPPSSAPPPRSLGHLWMLDPKLQKRLSTTDGVGTGAQTFHRRTIAGNMRHGPGSPALHTRRNRESSVSSESETVVPVLEETSLADFLRALDSLHSRVGTPKAHEDPTVVKKMSDPSSCHSSLQWISEKTGENNNVLGNATNIGGGVNGGQCSQMPIFPTGMRRASLFNNRRTRRTSLSSTDSGSVMGHPRGQSRLRRGSLRS